MPWVRGHYRRTTGRRYGSREARAAGIALIVLIAVVVLIILIR
ncbi:MAG TPA: hypothetical protein VK453_06655 [Micromonosporaceae bacterium]|nr:hypothetical protein [Micromonosporaceae bacterium]